MLLDTLSNHPETLHLTRMYRRGFIPGTGIKRVRESKSAQFASQYSVILSNTQYSVKLYSVGFTFSQTCMPRTLSFQPYGESVLSHTEPSTNLFRTFAKNVRAGCVCWRRSVANLVLRTPLIAFHVGAVGGFMRCSISGTWPSAANNPRQVMVDQELPNMRIAIRRALDMTAVECLAFIIALGTLLMMIWMHVIIEGV